MPTAIITGASSGIGRETAIALASEGWNVAVVARRQNDLDETVSLSQADANVLSAAGDVTNETFVKSMFDKALETFGRVDLLFNNAGISTPQIPIEETSLESFQRVIDVNVTGSFLCTREAFRVFKLNENPKGGRIINNGSLSAHAPRPFSFAYTTSKHAITGLTKCTALDGRAHSIACMQIDIGNARTAMGARLGSKEGTLQPDGSMKSEATMDVKNVVDVLLSIARLPNEVNVLELIITPSQAPFVGRG